MDAYTNLYYKSTHRFLCIVNQVLLIYYHSLLKIVVCEVRNSFI